MSGRTPEQRNDWRAAPLLADRAGLPTAQLIVGRLDPCGRLIATARHAIADCAAALGRVLDAR